MAYLPPRDYTIFHSMIIPYLLVLCRPAWPLQCQYSCHGFARRRPQYSRQRQRRSNQGINCFPEESKIEAEDIRTEVITIRPVFEQSQSGWKRPSAQLPNPLGSSNAAPRIATTPRNKMAKVIGLLLGDHFRSRSKT